MLEDSTQEKGGVQDCSQFFKFEFSEEANQNASSIVGLTLSLSIWTLVLEFADNEVKSTDSSNEQAVANKENPETQQSRTIRCDKQDDWTKIHQHKSCIKRSETTSSSKLHGRATVHRASFNGNSRGRFICSHKGCKFRSTGKDTLHKHLIEEHGDRKYLKKCAYCSYLCSSNYLMNKHIATHLARSKKSYKCTHSECDYTAKYKAALITHLTNDHGEISNLKKCSQCDFFSPLDRVMKTHTESHLPHDKRSHKCHYLGCGYGASANGSLVDHLVKKHGETKCVKYCAHCDYTSASRTCLAKHIQTHLPKNEKRHQCSYPDCTYGAATKSLLLTHLARKHNTPTQWLQCEFCDFATLYRRNLSKHVGNKHHPEKVKTIPCTYSDCSYRTKLQSTLKVHFAKAHGETKDLKKCTFCDYATTCNATLRHHTAIHLPENKKNYPCHYSECSYFAFARYPLKNHLSKVHGEKEHLKYCPHCDFSTVSHLERHLQTHLTSEKKKFKCKYDGCQYSSERSDSLNVHYGKKHGEKKYLKKCPHCSFTTVHSNSIKSHIETHLGSKFRSFTCHFPKCEYSCSNKASLSGHLAKKHGEKQYLKYKCPHCEYATSGSRELKRHVGKHLPARVNPHKCTFKNCKYTAYTKPRLQNHMANRHGDRKYLKYCALCQYKIGDKSILQKHIQSHFQKNDGSLRCSYAGCRFIASSKCALKSHAAKYHGETKDSKKCPLCDYSTTWGGYMKLHIKTHTPNIEKSFKCTHKNCNYSCSQRSKLRSHLANKHGQTKHLMQCAHCSYSAACKDRLIKHLKTHLPANERNMLKCTYKRCKFSCLTKMVLKNHLLKQHGEKKYLKKCTFCDFMTAYAWSLTLHMTIHLPENRRYACNFQGCGYSAARKRDIDVHLKKHHQDA